MDKLIIICGGDRLGKGTLIEGLCDFYEYKNIMIRHCDKPPKNLPHNRVLDHQMRTFKIERDLIFYYLNMDYKHLYHNNIIIYDRFYLGEYVYSQMFRNGDPDVLKNLIIDFEKGFKSILYKTFLIVPTADPVFFHNIDDGNSFSKNIEDKTTELRLFKEAFEFSTLKNKLLLKVDNNGAYRKKEDILSQVLQFIEF